MIPILTSFLQWLVAGLAAALALDPSLRGRRLIGYAFLLGSGIASLCLLSLSIAGIAWTPLRASLALGAVTLALWVLALLRRRQQRPAEEAPASTADRAAAIPVDLLTLAVVVGHAKLATLARVGEWDFWAIWGLKGRVFSEAGAIDWGFLQHPYNAFSHPDYPLLLPLNYAWLALSAGGWNDRWMGMLTTAFGLALLLIVRDLFEEELGGRTLAALATLSLATFALSPWMGMAEGPLVAFGAAALLTIRRGFVRRHEESVALGAVLLGFAAFTKNEGISLAGAVLAGALVYLRGRWREIAALWPAVAIAAPWVIIRLVRGLETDLTSGPLAERAARQMGNLPDLASALSRNVPDEPVFWVGVVLTVLLFARIALQNERFLIVAVVVQVLFYIAAYVVTPNDLEWHVASSWVRLLEQIAVPAAFAALVVLGRVLEGRVGYPSGHDAHSRFGS